MNKDMLKEILNKIETIYDMVDEAINESTKIYIEKKENGKVHIEFNGTRHDILVTLAGIEQRILNKLDCDAQEFDFIKNAVDVTEVTDNE